MLEKYKNNLEEEPQKKRKWFRVVLFLLIIGAVLLLFLAGWLSLKGDGFDFLKWGKSKNDTTNTNIVEEKHADEIASNEEKLSFADSKANQAQANNNNDEATSKNYRIKQIKFGGNILLNETKKDIPLEITDVSSETVTSQEDEAPKFLITWKTSKEAISDVVYAKNDGSDAKKASEDGYGFEHSVLLDGIDYSTIYVFRIKSKDRWGNEVATEYFSAYTGEKTESIFDLITNAIEDVFGWAMKK